MVDTPGDVPTDIERFLVNLANSKLSKMKQRSSGEFLRRMARDEHPGRSHKISTEKTFVHRVAAGGMHRRSMATPNVGPG
jgi:hypothetical protein